MCTCQRYGSANRELCYAKIADDCYVHGYICLLMFEGSMKKLLQVSR